ncbi:hypothetical protein TRIUR3_32352 [Triticum urartu]|uniref:Uncharacterized protein n=1 Tax=Triticum urartu TaxID=4572 RepID=M7YXA6_TRIUA|nr:hypothetical protein TRIUR3_32352 [Triticum urartu]
MAVTDGYDKNFEGVNGGTDNEAHGGSGGVLEEAGDAPAVEIDGDEWRAPRMNSRSIHLILGP